MPALALGAISVADMAQGLAGADRHSGGRCPDPSHAALVHRGPALSLAVPIQYSVVAGAGCGDRYRVKLACGEVTADQARAESGGGD